MLPSGIHADFAWPVADPTSRVTSAFVCRPGDRTDAGCPSGHRRHNGFDIRGRNTAAPIVTIADGTVEKAVQDNEPGFLRGFSKYGRVVVVNHDNQFWTLYAHLSSVRVRPGQRVSRGDVLGIMGKTAGDAQNPEAVMGRSSEHLHFEIAPRRYPLAKDSPRLNPAEVLPAGPTYFREMTYQEEIEATRREIEAYRQRQLAKQRKPPKGGALVGLFIFGGGLAFLATRK